MKDYTQTWVIRDAEGNITSEHATEAEANAELAYCGEEYEVTTAHIDEAFEFVFGISPEAFFTNLAKS